MVDLSIKLDPIRMPFFNEKIIDNLISKKLDFQTLKNPDFQIGKIVLQQAEFPVIQARNNLYPTLDLAYTISGNQVSNTRPGYFPGANSGNIVALNFSMPIGFVGERHEMAATNLSYLKAQRDFNQLKIQLSRDWENIVANYKLLREQIQIARLLVQAAKEKYDAALPTATLGTTYQQNVISFQNELVSFGTSLNLLEVDFINAQLQVLTFHADPHVYEVFAPYGLK
jgi:outer membrane protein TolC